MASYTLTDDEVLLLDGRCSVDNQKEIDSIKQAREIHSHPIIGKSVATSLRIGTYRSQFKSIRYCDLCKSSGGYAVHKRNGRFHRKGEKDHSKPLHMNGIEINAGFITISGYGTCCEKCNQESKITETIVSIILNRDLPIQLLHNAKTRWLKDDKQICFSCEKEMYESEMGRLPCLMGGTYAGKCPHCSAEQIPFGRTHKSTSEFRMIRPANQQER